MKVPGNIGSASERSGKLLDVLIVFRGFLCHAETCQTDNISFPFPVLAGDIPATVVGRSSKERGM